MELKTFIDLRSIIQYVCLGLLLCSASTTIGQVAQMQQSVYKELGVTEVSLETQTIDSSMLTGEVWVRERWQINEAGYLTESTSYDDDGKVKALLYNTYDQDSLITHHRYILQTADGRKIHDTEYTYDKHNRIKQTKHFYDDQLTAKGKHTYNQDGLLKRVKQKRYANHRISSVKGKSEIQYRYDSSGRLAGQSILRTGFSETYAIGYSADGLKKTTYKSTSETTEKWLRDVQQENEYGQVISSVYYLANPKTSKVTMAGIPYLRGDRRQTRYTYDDLGLVTTESIYKNDILVQVKEYVYVFRE